MSLTIPEGDGKAAKNSRAAGRVANKSGQRNTSRSYRAVVHSTTAGTRLASIPNSDALAFRSLDWNLVQSSAHGPGTL